MFIGHYSVSFVARAAAPSISLWVFVAATQLLDIIWCLFIILGVEHVEADPTVTEGLRFVFYPYSHSLIGALFWSLVGGLLTKLLLRVSSRDASLAAGAVLSHWLFDLLVHRPDLPLWPGGDAKFGFGLWDAPALELGLEVGLFVLGGALVLALARRAGHRLWPWIAFLTFGVVFMVGMRSAEPAPVIDPGAVGTMGLGAYLTFVFLAWLAERLSARTVQGAAAR
jgi:hypothetical protein